MTDLFSHPEHARGNPPMVLLPDEATAVFLAAEEHQATADTAPVPVPAEQPPAGAPPAPVPMMAGTFAIYDDGAGGVMLVIQRDNGDVLHKHLPAQLIRMAEKFGGIPHLGAVFGKAE